MTFNTRVHGDFDGWGASIREQCQYPCEVSVDKPDRKAAGSGSIRDYWSWFYSGFSQTSGRLDLRNQLPFAKTRRTIRTRPIT
jgi:hypothetical protein